VTQLLPLALSFAHVAGLLAQAHAHKATRWARTAALDPFHLDLPPVDGAGAQVDASSLGVLGSLYFVAAIEATYLPAVAEELARNRFGLNLTDSTAAELMEDLARAMESGWIGRDLRNQITARVFGMGQDDPNLGDGVVNRTFEPRFANFCGALISAAQQQEWGSISAGAAIRLGVAAQAVFSNLGPKMQGNTLIVTERLSTQLQLSLAALNHPGLTRLFEGRTAWDVVRNLLGADTPDLARAITLAQTGMRLFSWMAANLTGLQGNDSASVTAALAREAAVAEWATQWLEASGVQIQAASPPQHAGWGALQ
jgi:hypothetical protein